MKHKAWPWHRHRWHVVPSFSTQRDFTWPPMWACPCGLMRDMQSLDEWGIE